MPLGLAAILSGVLPFLGQELGQAAAKETVKRGFDQATGKNKDRDKPVQFQMVDAQGISAETWTELSGYFGKAELIEIMFVAGAYLCFAIVLNSIDLPPDAPTEPVDAPDLPPRGS